MAIKKRPFWLSRDYGRFDALNGDVETEVAIIGGGITGVSAAYHLGEEGVDSVLLEKDSIASGATGHSMGGLVPGIEQEDIWQSIEKYGEGRTRTIWEASNGAIDEMAALCANGIECDFVRGPAFDLVEDKRELGFLGREHEAARRCGIETNIMDAAQIRDRLAVCDSMAGALEYTKCAQMNPAAFVHGLAGKAKKQKGGIFEHTGARRIAHAQGGLKISTDRGSVRAKKLIIAAESYTPDLGFLKNRMTTLRINALATERLDSSSMDKLGMRGAQAWNMSRDYNFVRSTADSRVIIDGGDSLSVASGDMPQEHRIEEIHSRLLDLFPMMEEIGVEFEWSGRMAAPIKHVPVLNGLVNAITSVVDIRLTLPLVERIGVRMISMPFLGRVGKTADIFCSAGYIGHGLPLGFLGGKVLGELCTGSVSEDSAKLLRAYEPRQS